MGVVWGDLLLLMNRPDYADYIRLSLVDFVVVGLFSSYVVCTTLLIVWFGNEVNESAAKHVSLLTRQRLIMTALRHRCVCDTDLRHRLPEDSATDDKTLHGCTESLEILAQAITAHHKAHPVTLLGFCCSFSLLSFLYVLPVGLLNLVIVFCSDSSTSRYCLPPS